MDDKCYICLRLWYWLFLEEEIELDAQDSLNWVCFITASPDQEEATTDIKIWFRDQNSGDNPRIFRFNAIKSKRKARSNSTAFFVLIW